MEVAFASRPLLLPASPTGGRLVPGVRPQQQTLFAPSLTNLHGRTFSSQAALLCCGLVVGRLVARASRRQQMQKHRARTFMTAATNTGAAAVVPEVMFVLGGPGTGKGTQCSKIIEHFSNWDHISAGDCLRSERNDPSSKDGAAITSFLQQGKIVPSSITVKLLQNAMSARMAAGKECFLIDGFPRNLENHAAWVADMGSACEVLGVLFFDADEAELEKRLLKRGETSGRDDDNIRSIKKRFRTHIEETLPVVEEYRTKGHLFAVDAMPPPEQVWASTKAIIKKLEASHS